MAAGTGKRILVVDDEELMREFYVRLLASRGYEVATAEHGIAAMQVLETHPPFDLAIVDLVMPVCNGWQLIDKIRNSPYASLPLLAVTGLANSSDELRVVGQQCEGLMMKADFDMTTFLQAVERLADLAKQRADANATATEVPVATPDKGDSPLIPVPGTKLTLRPMG